MKIEIVDFLLERTKPVKCSYAHCKIAPLVNNAIKK